MLIDKFLNIPGIKYNIKEINKDVNKLIIASLIR